MLLGGRTGYLALSISAYSVICMGSLGKLAVVLHDSRTPVCSDSRASQPCQIGRGLECVPTSVSAFFKERHLTTAIMPTYDTNLHQSQSCTLLTGHCCLSITTQLCLNCHVTTHMGTNPSPDLTSTLVLAHYLKCLHDCKAARLHCCMFA